MTDVPGESRIAINFDPYWEWLRVRGNSGRPGHYELLGLKGTDAPDDLIRQAFEDRYAHLRKYTIAPPHAEAALRILNELSEAATCLLEPRRRAEYDRQLRGELEDHPAPVSSSVMPSSMVAVPLPDTRASGDGQSLPSDAAERQDLPRLDGPEGATSRRRWLVAATSVAALAVVVLGMMHLVPRKPVEPLVSPPLALHRDTAPSPVQRFPTRAAIVELTDVSAETARLIASRLLEVAPRREGTTISTATSHDGQSSVRASIPEVADLKQLADSVGISDIAEIDVEAWRIKASPIPRAAKRPTDQDYYRANLAELSANDSTRRRLAAERLKTAERTGPRDEIVKALVMLMSDSAAATRRAAIDTWIVWRTESTASSAVPTLVKLVRDADYDVRRSALQGLNGLSDPTAAEAVAAFLTDASLSYEASALLRAMGVRGEKAVLPYLAHEDGTTRRNAWNVLEAIGSPASPECVPRLIELLGSDVETAQRALRVLGRFTDSRAIMKDSRAIMPVARLLVHNETRHKAAQMLLEAGPPAEGAVVSLLQHSDHQVVQEALKILAKVGTAECVPAVVGVIGHRESRVNYYALQTLEAVKADQSAEGAVVGLLQHSDQQVVQEALKILAKVGTAECVPAVVGMIGHRDSMVRNHAFRTLEAIKAPESASPLAALLDDGRHRRSAADVLRTLGPAAEDAVLAKLKSPDRSVCQECLRLLRTIGTEKSLKRIVPVTRFDQNLRSYAIDAINGIKGRSGGQPIAPPKGASRSSTPPLQPRRPRVPIRAAN